MQYLRIVLLGYLLGTPNIAPLLARRRGVDLADGTGNPGTSNVTLLMGWRPGVLTAAFDVGKGALAVRLALRLFSGAAYAGLVSGAACVLGHIFPFYRRFRGGKGIAAYLGMLLALDWRFALLAFAAAVLIGLFSDFPALGSLLVICAIPLCCLLTAHLVEAAVLGGTGLVVVGRHRENFARFRRGAELSYRDAARNRRTKE